jgi:DNA-directed RNA polymerase
MHWADQNTGGYWLPTKQNNLVKARNRSNGVRGMTGDDAPRMFAPLNYLQAVPYRINRKVLAVVERMRESGIACDSLPSFDLETPPPRPSDIDTNEEARKEWRTATRGVHTRNNARKGKLLATSRTISVAADMRDEPTIYFPKMIDFRGRVYDLPLFLKPQGDDLSKGLLEFANGKPLGDMGAYWLAIHLANTWGEDKVSFDDRQAWVRANEDRILAIARDPFAERMWMDADSPFQFLAACFEWLGYNETGEAHVSHISIGLDGSCNGLQHLSAILRDPVGGAAVNLLPASKPQDIYTEVMVKVKAELTRRAEAGEPTAQRWLPLVTRKTVKRPVMTLPYGATQQGFADQIMEDTLRPIEKSGQSPFGSEGYDACRYLGSIVWQATGETVVAARQVMDWLQEVAKVVAETAAPLSWETPSGFRVVQNYHKPRVKDVELRALGQRVCILVADGHTAKMDKQKMARSISPNFVHALDAAHMLRTVELLLDTVGPSVHLSMVHDSYGCHACDADTLSRALRQAFVQMYHEKDWLEAFRAEVGEQLGESLADQLPPLPAKGELHLSEVVNSLYFFA